WERLTMNLLGGQPLRRPDGKDNGVRLIDIDNDGYLDVVIGNDNVKQTRHWLPKEKRWVVGRFPTWIAQLGDDNGCRFGIVREDGHTSFVQWYLNTRTGPTTLSDYKLRKAWSFSNGEWIEERGLLTGWDEPTVYGRSDYDGVRRTEFQHDRGVRLRDLDG